MLGEGIKELRKARWLNQVGMAKRLSGGKRCISNWENGHMRPSVDMPMRLAAFFHVSCDDLRGLEERRFLEISGLSAEPLTQVQLLVSDLAAATRAAAAPQPT